MVCTREMTTGSESGAYATRKRKKEEQRSSNEKKKKNRSDDDGEEENSNAMSQDQAGTTPNSTDLEAEDGEDDDVISFVDIENEEQLQTASVAATGLLPSKSDGDVSGKTDINELEKMLNQRDKEGNFLYSLLKPSIFTETMEELYRICRQPSTYATRFDYFKWTGSVKVRFSGTVPEELAKEFSIGTALPSKKGCLAINGNYFPMEGILTLYLRTVDWKVRDVKTDSWHEWLYVTRNKKTTKAIGLYSSRRFSKGEIIGPYDGAVYWSKKNGDKKGPECPAELHERVRALTKGAYVDGPDCTCLVSPLVTTEHRPLRGMMMGFRFMARASSNRRTKEANVEILRNGFVVATKTIKKNTELVSPL